MNTKGKRLRRQTVRKNHPARPYGFHPRIEQLEDRCLLSIGGYPELPGMVLVDPVENQFQDQIVYLDFNGAEGVTYNGPIVVEGIDIPVFEAPGNLAGQEELVIVRTLERVQRIFADTGVVFTVDTTAIDVPHSVVYVGGDSSPFASYGFFSGVAEQVDFGTCQPV